MITKITKVLTDSGPAVELPVLFSSAGIPVGSLLKFQCEHLTKSMAWHRKLVLHVRLLLEFAEANPSLCQNSPVLFQTFLNRLSLGSIEDGYDPSGLYWMPKQPAQIRQIAANLTTFSSFVSRLSRTRELNPLREADPHERICVMAARMFRQEHSFLKHLQPQSKIWRAAGTVRHSFNKLRQTPRVDGNAVTRFPSERFGDLILNGFATRPWNSEPWMKLNVRDVLITLLLHGGGLRVSEPFHMFISDVAPDPLDTTKALVRIGHPSWGLVTWRDSSNRPLTTTRAEYLARHGLPQRELVAGPMRAGWKNPVLDGKFYLEVRWAHPGYGRLFLKLWEIYLRQYLSLHSPPNHPWAWVSFDPKTEGAPLKVQRYMDAHEQAVRRIGLQAGREHGTNPHAHRHSYGYWLESLKLKKEVIRRFMHHASASSQDVYKQESDGALHEALESGLNRLRETPPPVLQETVKRTDHELLEASLTDSRRTRDDFIKNWEASLERLNRIQEERHE
ncbi:gamma-mobile-trio recombinase GmtY [Oleiharenicola sp. Vm1]|uniref:gamma-mobile-trio recombinase GmtY n=1 Tax=Oleiharenicola sp. Vm1 TaxID=3398393 RepID=UPI0039F49D16